ncbi:MAG TPA: hypothetical protein VF791_05465 [Pyrinomonadaceae bacterium]
MKKSLSVIIAAVALSVAFGSVMSAAQERKPIILGGYSKVATDNPEVQAAAEFAVNEQGERQSAAITLSSIERAERQSAAGTNFKLCLKVEIEGETEDDTISQTVSAVVHRNLQQEFSLKSWEEADCAE